MALQGRLVLRSTRPCLVRFLSAPPKPPAAPSPAEVAKQIKESEETVSKIREGTYLTGKATEHSWANQSQLDRMLFIDVEFRFERCFVGAAGLACFACVIPVTVDM
jgi:hypothetical protein